MFAKRKPTNPFYFLLVLVGLAFVISACAYGVMAYRDVTAASGVGEAGLLQFMDQHGVVVLSIEVLLLGLFTVAAIGTDDFWQRRTQTATSNEDAHTSNSD